MPQPRTRRPLWKLATNRKAVSTVISTVLMTSLAIMMGTLVVFWASQTLGNYQGSAGVYFANRSNALKESFVIEDIWFYRSSQPTCWTQSSSGSYYCVNVTVRNTGAIDLKVVAIYLNSTSYPVSKTLTVGQSVTITLTLNPAYDSTKVYFFIIATARGNKVTEFWKASN